MKTGLNQSCFFLRFVRANTVAAVLSGVSLLMSVIVIGIIGYNFSYYKVNYIFAKKWGNT